MLASALAGEGRPAGADLRALLDDRVSAAINYLAGLLLIVILVLMVWKPA